MSNPSNPSTLDVLKRMEIRAESVVTDAFHAGMEAGMRRVWGKGPISTDTLHALIRQLDVEFDCPCNHAKHGWADGRCNRCGVTDPLAPKAGP